MNELLKHIQSATGSYKNLYQQLIPILMKAIQEFYNQKMGLTFKDRIEVEVLDFTEDIKKLISSEYSDVLINKLSNGGVEFKRNSYFESEE